jgi:V/A-type H+-transporting ATPase subunit C
VSTAGTSNPEYVVARVRSRRSSLFDEEDYRKLVRMGPSEIARFMEESAYEREVNALGARHSGVDLIEFALNRNMARNFDDLLQWADGELYGLIARYLRKFDAWNAKTIIRGLYADSDRESVEADLIRAGEFDDDFVDRLLDAGSIEEVVELLDRTMFGESLPEAFDDYEATGELVPLENAIDRAFYEHLMDDLPSSEATDLYREFLEAEIDFRNARNALRLSRSGADIDPADYYIDGGRLFSAAELSTLSQNVDELVAALRDSKYGDQLSDALAELESTNSLIQFERTLDAALVRYGDRLGGRFPLSVTPIISYILAKEREVNNVRAIARGREAGIDPDRIESELVTI